MIINLLPFTGFTLLPFELPVDILIRDYQLGDTSFGDMMHLLGISPILNFSV